MNIIINGETKEIPPDYTPAQLVELLGLGGKRLAMEVNQEIVPRSTFQDYHFREGDRVEIVHAIGGG